MTSQKVGLVKGVGWHVQKEKGENVHLLKICQLVQIGGKWASLCANDSI